MRSFDKNTADKLWYSLNLTMNVEQRHSLATILGPPNEGLRPGMDFMQEMWDTFHVEIGALIGRSALERPYDEQQLTIAEQFFTERSPERTLLTADLMEVNRTIMNIFIGRALLHPDAIRGSYEVITDCQNPAIRLTHPKHDWLRGFARDILETRQRTMETGLMRADIGKSKQVIDYMRTRKQKIYADHDRLVVDLSEDAVAARRWTPSFCWLPAEEQQLLLNIDRSGYHMPQDILGESPISKWVAFQKLSKEEQRFGLLLGLLDIAGAQGDRVQNGSKTLVEPTVTSFQALVKAHMTPVPAGYSDQEAVLYKSDIYRQFRGEQLGISFDQPYGHELIRLCCNLIYDTPDQAAFTQDVVKRDMEAEDREDLLELMAFTGFEPEGHAWIMYLPALIKRYKEKLEDKGRSPREALDAGLTLAAHTYAAAKEQIDLSPGVVIVAGDLVRAFEKDPRIPLTQRIRIDSISPTEAKASFELAA